MLIETVTDSSEESPIVHIRFKTKEGIVLNEYSCTQDQYVLSLLDSEMRDYRKLEFKRFKGLKPKLIYDRTETPALPTACVKHVWLSQAKKQQLIFVEVAKQQWDVPFFKQDEVYERVGFPRLIFGYFLKERRVVELYCLAVKEHGRITDEMELYRFPYANVYSGLVCMGGGTYFLKLRVLLIFPPTTICSSQHPLRCARIALIETSLGFPIYLPFTKSFRIKISQTNGYDRAR